MFLAGKSLKKYATVLAGLLLAAPVWAAGPPAENLLYNPLSLVLISVMFILLIAIAILGNVLIGAADMSFLKWKKAKEDQKKSAAGKTVAAFIGLTISSSLYAQDATAVTKTASVIGGLPSSVFYIMITIVFAELLVFWRC